MSRDRSGQKVDITSVPHFAWRGKAPLGGEGTSEGTREGTAKAYTQKCRSFTGVPELIRLRAWRHTFAVGFLYSSRNRARIAKFSECETSGYPQFIRSFSTFYSCDGYIALRPAGVTGADQCLQNSNSWSKVRHAFRCFTTTTSLGVRWLKHVVCASVGTEIIKLPCRLLSSALRRGTG